uniref:Methyltransf_21 domain-containing protein n=1 Tax=Panagrellus redivivus TaxID=6233 RepID=A0A7E4UXV6_PANRE
MTSTTTFPLEKLTYEMQQRLIELATPNEAYRLQQIAPEIAAFQKRKLNVTHQSKSVWIVGTDTNDIDFLNGVFGQIPYGDEDVIVCDGVVQLDKLTDAHLKHAVFNHVYLKPEKVMTDGTNFGPAMLELLAEHDMSQAKGLHIDFEDDVDYAKLLALFPNVDHFGVLGKVDLSWISKIRVNRAIDVIEVTALGEDLPKCSAKDVLTLFENQEDLFYVLLTIYDDEIDSEVTRNQDGFTKYQTYFDELLKDHFYLDEDEEGVGGKRLIVNYFHYWRSLNYVLK